MRAVKSSKYADVAKLILESEALPRATLSMNEDAVAKGIAPFAHNILLCANEL